MSKKSSTYCFCEAARFSGGYLATPCADVIEISLKFEKTHEKDDANSIPNNSTDKCNLNFLELSQKTMSDVCSNVGVHQCVSGLLQQILTKPTITSPEEASNAATTEVIVHQESEDESRKEVKVTKRNSSLRSSMKSSHSMETILEKKAARKSLEIQDDTKAKSVSHLNDDGDEEYEYIENGESIELIFISDEFVNKVQKQEQEVIVLDEHNGKRRESLTNNKKEKIVIITDEYKNKVLRNNSIVVTTKEKKLKKKLRKSKTYSTSTCEDEDFSIMEDKKIDKKSHLTTESKEN
jgi:hypothetical protein